MVDLVSIHKVQTIPGKLLTTEMTEADKILGPGY